MQKEDANATVLMQSPNADIRTAHGSKQFKNLVLTHLHDIVCVPSLNGEYLINTFNNSNSFGHL